MYCSAFFTEILPSVASGILAQTRTTFSPRLPFINMNSIIDSNAPRTHEDLQTAMILFQMAQSTSTKADDALPTPNRISQPYHVGPLRSIGNIKNAILPCASDTRLDLSVQIEEDELIETQFTRDIPSEFDKTSNVGKSASMFGNEKGDIPGVKTSTARTSSDVPVTDKPVKRGQRKRNTDHLNNRDQDAIKKLKVIVEQNPFQFPFGSTDVTERWRVVARILFNRTDVAFIETEQHNIGSWTKQQIVAYRQQFEINASGHNDGKEDDDGNVDGVVRSP